MTIPFATTPNPKQECPWCGTADALRLEGDGLGGVTVRCGTCGCKGPPAPIADGFDEGDRMAIERWRARPEMPSRLSAEVLARVERMINFEAVANGRLDDSSSICIAYGDLRQMLHGRI